MKNQPENPSTMEIVHMCVNEVIEGTEFEVEYFEPLEMRHHGVDITMKDVFSVIGSVRARDTGVVVSHASTPMGQGLTPAIAIFDMADPDFVDSFKDHIKAVMRDGRDVYG